MKGRHGGTMFGPGNFDVHAEIERRAKFKWKKLRRAFISLPTIHTLHTHAHRGWAILVYYSSKHFTPWHRLFLRPPRTFSSRAPRIRPLAPFPPYVWRAVINEKSRPTRTFHFCSANATAFILVKRQSRKPLFLRIVSLIDAYRIERNFFYKNPKTVHEKYVTRDRFSSGFLFRSRRIYRNNIVQYLYYVDHVPPPSRKPPRPARRVSRTRETNLILLLYRYNSNR